MTILTDTDFERQARAAIGQWQEDLTLLEEKDRVVHDEMGAIRAKISNMETAISDFRTLHRLPDISVPSSLTGRLRELSTKDMVLTVLHAEHSISKPFKALDIARRLAHVGMFDNVGSASDSIYSMLGRNRRTFKHIAKGLYLLNPAVDVQAYLDIETSTPETASSSSKRGTAKLFSKVETIQGEHPNWGRDQILAELTRQGWPFNAGRDPARAVQFAINHNNGKSKKQRLQLVGTAN